VLRDDLGEKLTMIVAQQPGEAQIARRI